MTSSVPASTLRSQRAVRSRRGTRSGSCASAASRRRRRRGEPPGAMAAVLGLDDRGRGACAGIDGVWPANYNCPGRSSSRSRAGSRSARWRPRPRGTPRRVSRLRVTGRFPQPARRCRSRPASPRDRGGHLARAEAAVHVHRHRRVRGAGSPRQICSSSSSPPPCGSRRRFRRRRRRDRPLRRGRPRPGPRRPRQAHRPPVASDLRRRPGVARKLEEVLSTGAVTTPASARSRRRSCSSPAARAGSAPPCRASSPCAGARVAVNYRAGHDAAEALAAEIGGRRFQADVADA